MAKSAEQLLERIFTIQDKIFDHAVIGVVFAGAVIHHPKLVLIDIKTNSIGNVYRKVFNANRDSLSSK